MAKVNQIQDKNGNVRDIVDKALDAKSTVTTLSSTDEIVAKTTGGAYEGITPANLASVLGVINSNNIKIKTRLEAEAIWTGYWDAVLTIESSNSGVGVAGFELAVIIGDSPKMAIRNKINGGAWSSWKIWS